MRIQSSRVVRSLKENATRRHIPLESRFSATPLDAILPKYSEPADSKALTGTKSLPQPLYNQHLHATSANVANKRLISLADAIFTRNCPVTSVDATFTKSAGVGLVFRSFTSSTSSAPFTSRIRHEGSPATPIPSAICALFPSHRGVGYRWDSQSWLSSRGAART